MIHQFYQSAYNIKFIELVHLKYGSYKPREVEHPKRKRAQVYKSRILNGPINKILYIAMFVGQRQVF